MTIEKMIELIGREGIPLVISALVILLGYQWLKHRMKQEISGKSVHKDFPFDYDIQRHSILSTLEIFYSTTIHTICFKNAFKQVLWTDFLVSYYRSMHKYIEDGLVNEYYNLPHSKFKGEVTSWILKLPPYCEQRVLEELGQFFEDPAIMPVILQRFRVLFRHNHGQFFQSLTELFETTALVNNKQRLAAILYAWKGYNMLAITMFEQVLNELNGDLDNVVYKSIKNEVFH